MVKVETIYLNLPTNKPDTAILCNAFEKMGSFFAGIQPGFESKDQLVLQYLNKQIYQYETLTFDENFITFKLRYIVDYQLRRSIKVKIFTSLIDEIKNTTTSE